MDDTEKALKLIAGECICSPTQRIGDYHMNKQCPKVNAMAYESDFTIKVKVRSDREPPTIQKFEYAIQRIDNGTKGRTTNTLLL